MLISLHYLFELGLKINKFLKIFSKCTLNRDCIFNRESFRFKDCSVRLIEKFRELRVMKITRNHFITSVHKVREVK